MRIPKTLYIVADGGRVRYIERTGPQHFTTFRKFVSAHMHEKATELRRDRAARIRESATSARHAIEARIDPRDKVEVEFIQAIARDLLEDKTISEYENLVIIAPGKLQKVFREALPPSLTAKLVKCIGKDLTKVPDVDLARHLPEFLVSQATS